MPKLRPIMLALMLGVASAAVVGCGGNNGPPPSISAADAQTLLAKIQEIQANVQVGSCIVAGDKTDELIADVSNLPSSVDSKVRQALDSGANNLKLLLSDPSQCQGRTTTSAPSTTSTTESTTTTKTRPSTTTTRTQPQPTTTTPTQSTPTNPSGGVGPGSPGGL